MWAAVLGLPDQVAAAQRAGRSAALSGDLTGDRPLSHVVVLGVGDDGFSGDVVQAATEADLPVPLVVVRSADLPAFVDQSTLVFAVSWSGATPTTIAGAADALARGASLIAVSGKGELVQLARRVGAPVVPVPEDLPRARAALGALAVPMLVILERLGLVADVERPLAAVVDQLTQRRDGTGGDVPATVARRIGRTLPLIHGGSGLVGLAAARWKTQINENAKSPAFSSNHPELIYNELAGWGQSGDVTRQLVTLVQLRTEQQDPTTAGLFDTEAELLREVVADVVPVVGQGRGDLAQFFDLVLIGDLVSLHLAAAEDVDPGPVPAVADMERLVAGWMNPG
jgi:glucose/mannose-6-phosphate isomerase